jgi:hypothetical protein
MPIIGLHTESRRLLYQLHRQTVWRCIVQSLAADDSLTGWLIDETSPTTYPPRDCTTMASLHVQHDTTSSASCSHEDRSGASACRKEVPHLLLYEIYIPQFGIFSWYTTISVVDATDPMFLMSFLAICIRVLRTVEVGRRRALVDQWTPSSLASLGV